MSRVPASSGRARAPYAPTCASPVRRACSGRTGFPRASMRVVLIGMLRPRTSRNRTPSPRAIRRRFHVCAPSSTRYLATRLRRFRAGGRGSLANSAVTTRVAIRTSRRERVLNKSHSWVTSLRIGDRIPPRSDATESSSAAAIFASVLSDGENAPFSMRRMASTDRFESSAKRSCVKRLSRRKVRRCSPNRRPTGLAMSCRRSSRRTGSRLKG